ncbi:MAG: hypothetical protein RI883_576 [Bacteroidota bacterium]|jgi:gliding motility-associated-like protein
MRKLIYTIALTILSVLGSYAQSDNCATATPITLVGGTLCVNGTSSGGTADNTTTTCNASPSVNFVWYQFTCTGTQNNITLTPGTLQNSVLVVDGTACGDNAIDFCNNATGTNPITILNSQTVGTTVLVAIGSTSGNDGTFQLCVTSITPTTFSGGDLCSNAILFCDPNANISVPDMSIYTGVGAGGKPSCFFGGGSNPTQDVFFKFTVYQNGTIAWSGNPNNNTTEFDWTLYNITSGCPGTEICCNYNFSGQLGANFGQAAGGAGPCGTAAGGGAAGEFSPTTAGVAGQTYAIYISNWSGNGTGFVFDFTGTAAIAPIAGFTINPNTVTCGPSVNVTINNTSTAAANWTYGDGTTYTGTTPPAHIYSTPGTYPITATIPGACPSTATQYVNLFGPLVGTIAGTNATCPSSTNGTATITSLSGGNGIYTYLWSGPSQNGATTSSITSLTPGSYSVTVSNAVCGSSIVLNVVIGVANALDNASFSVSNYCVGAANSATITGTSGGVFSFNPVPGGGVTINSATGAISGGVGGATYTVQYTTLGACPATQTDPVTVIAIDNPSFSIANFCAGSANSAIITGTAGGTFTFNPVPGGGVSINSVTGAITGGIGGTTYTVQYTTSGTCPANTTHTVNVNALPTFSLTFTNPSICGSSDGSLTISGLNNSASYAVTYMDGATSVGPTNYTSSGAGVIILSGLNAGSYNGFSLTLNSTGCVGTNPTLITLVDPGAPVLVITNPPAVCSPLTVDITAASVTSGSTGGGVLSYWTNIGATQPLGSPSAVSVGGTYYIQTNNAGCLDIEAVVVTVNQTPNIVITDPTAVCSPLTVDITAATITVGSTNPGVLAYWNDATATSALLTPSTVSMSNTYYIQATNAGCTDIAAVEVTINPTPVLTITDPAAVCSPLTVDITAANITAGSTNTGTLTYWNDAAATSSLATPALISASNIYYIQATNTGCVDIAAVIVTINPIPAAPAAGTDATYCESWDFIPMTVTGTGGVFSWYLNSGLTDSPTIGSTILPNDVLGTTVYYVTETLLGCEGPASTVTITIQNCEITVPTAFTPDGDLVNDNWEIIDLDNVYPDNVVMIYNRWGAKLYESKKGDYSSKPWNGSFEGKTLPVGSYYFIIDLNTDKSEPMKGIVSIILE